MVAALVLLLLTPTNTQAFWWTLAGLVGLLAMPAAYWILTHPVNKFWTRDLKLKGAGAGFFAIGKGKVAAQATDSDDRWLSFRNRWEYSQSKWLAARNQPWKRSDAGVRRNGLAREKYCKHRGSLQPARPHVRIAAKFCSPSECEVNGCASGLHFGPSKFGRRGSLRGRQRAGLRSEPCPGRRRNRRNGEGRSSDGHLSWEDPVDGPGCVASPSCRCASA